MYSQWVLMSLLGYMVGEVPQKGHPRATPHLLHHSLGVEVGVKGRQMGSCA